MNAGRKVVRVSETKRVVVTSFKNGVWLHLQDTRKGKSISFSKEDFVNLLDCMGKIQKSVKECEKQNKKQKKLNQKWSHSDSSMSSDSDSDE